MTDLALTEGPGGVAQGVQGRAVQVDPIKPTLKPPGTKRLNLEYNKLLLILAFKCNLRCYNKEKMQEARNKGACLDWWGQTLNPKP
jgi:hypothetical protein